MKLTKFSDIQQELMILQLTLAGGTTMIFLKLYKLILNSLIHFFCGIKVDKFQEIRPHVNLRDF